jgi:exodeoxyribonuclease V beta subunit
MYPLDPLNCPLHGQMLIEASAGTGKTYTISLFFLRLLVEQDLGVDEILTLTFTHAATEELRSRIRQRIRDAVDILEGQGPDDHTLRKLLARYSDSDRTKVLLTDALTRMDEAAIYTIHSFCQRMLQDHAFESGVPFEMELIDSQDILQNRIMEDFWRQHFYSASLEEAAWAASLWKSPQELLGQLGPHLDRSDIIYLPEITEQELSQQKEQVQQLFIQMQATEPQQREELIEILNASSRLSRDNKKSYGLKRLQGAVDLLEKFLAAPQVPWLLAKDLELFTQSMVDSCLNKKSAPAPEHPFFADFEDFFTAHRQMTKRQRISILRQARHVLHTELTRRKQEQQQVYFDDLLSFLAQGLQGDQGQHVARNISKRFPIIMVDEFQDTDPLQYQIISRIHAAHHRKSEGLFLIGDPKQAIYSFRGADIFTYLKARQDTPEKKRLTMCTNHRASQAMIEAVQQLFDHPSPFVLPKHCIDFPKVQAAASTKDGPPLAPFTCLLLPKSAKPLAKNTAQEAAARFCVHEIGHLLESGAFEAGDVAVLVRTHAEGALMRKELKMLGLTSVCWTQDSIFASPEAQHVLLFMHSLNALNDRGLRHTVLAGELFGWTAEQIYHLNHDEQQQEEVLKLMARYQNLWQEQGFLPMFQQVLWEQQVLARLLPAGERSLTNFLHLAELLQEAARDHLGREPLVQWFSGQIEQPEYGQEKQQLRLESDENLVKIITIHKAKGLEYPVVFLPFPWSGRSLNVEEPLVFHRLEQPEQSFIDFGSGLEEHLHLARQEQLAEDLRILYVAVTRAKYACYFTWGEISKMEESALFYLLQGDLNRLQAYLDVKEYPENFVPPVLPGQKSKAHVQAAQFKGNIRTGWHITSYSALTSHRNVLTEQPDYDQSTVEQGKQEESPGFPKGAAAGTCLHAILEDIHFQNSEGHEEVIQRHLARAGFADFWLPLVHEWMQAILHTKLIKDFSLAQLGEKQRLNEMSFFFPLADFRLASFNQVLADFGHAPLPHKQERLQGLMTGFVDLVFSYQGKYYIADYKSNYLGTQPTDYSPDKLLLSMNEHRYDLQYLLYTVALHRFLATRIRGYAYEQHVGGVFYLFLRGMNPSNPKNTGIFKSFPEPVLIQNLDRCFGAGSVCEKGKGVS